MEEPKKEKLFSYSTLQYEKVQLDAFGRKLKGIPDTLIAYKLAEMTVSDPKILAASGQAVHSVAAYTGDPEDKISGIVFDVSLQDLEHVDAYEVHYKRVRVLLASGHQAWLYVAKDS